MESWYNFNLKLEELSIIPSASELKVTPRSARTQTHCVYFLKGNDPRQLKIDFQQQIASFVEKDALSSSLLVYNP